MRRPWLAIALALAAAALVTVPSASASRFIQHGIFDDAQINYGDPDKVFPQLKQLNTQLIRVNLVWGGPNGVSKRKPVNPTNPNDPAYDWSVYDRTVFYAQQNGIKVVFSIVGTPPWANGAKGVNVVPKSALDLERFATAAARRYSGTFRTKEGRILPPVRQWLAWNEPNNPAFLRPQYVTVKGKPVIQSAIDYAKICNAIVKGVRKTTRRRVEGGLRRHRPARQQQPELLPARRLAAPVRAGDEEGRARRASTPTRITRTTAPRARRRARRRRPGSTATRRPRSRSATSTC